MFIGYVITLWLLPAVLHATVYVWQDESRHKYFSDRAYSEDARPMTLPPVQTYKSTQSDMRSPSAADRSVTNPEYRIHWQKPVDRQTIHNNQGQFVVQVTLEPALKKSDEIQLWIDGMAYASPQKTLLFQISDLSRGAHELSLAIINQGQEIKQHSQPITIYLHRATKN